LRGVVLAAQTQDQRCEEDARDEGHAVACHSARFELADEKSAMPPIATVIAIASRARIGSRTTSGEKSSTHTTPAYCRKIAFAAVVHFVATTNAVRQSL
jgi:hypothetical protein